MLSAEQLTQALVGAQRDAKACSATFCRAGGSIQEGAYLCWHNGTGSSTTNEQRVYASSVLALPPEQLQARLAGWLAALHKRERVDLNEAPK